MQRDLKVESQTGKPDEKLEKAGAEVRVIMEKRLERERKWGQQNRKVFRKEKRHLSSTLPGSKESKRSQRHFSPLCSRWLAGSIRSQSSGESQLNAMKWNKIGWSIAAWQRLKPGR